MLDFGTTASRMTFLQLAVIFILEQNVLLGKDFWEGLQTQFWSCVQALKSTFMNIEWQLSGQ